MVSYSGLWSPNEVREAALSGAVTFQPSEESSYVLLDYVNTRGVATVVTDIDQSYDDLYVIAHLSCPTNSSFYVNYESTFVNWKVATRTYYVNSTSPNYSLYGTTSNPYIEPGNYTNCQDGVPLTYIAHIPQYATSGVYKTVAHDSAHGYSTGATWFARTTGILYTSETAPITDISWQTTVAAGFDDFHVYLYGVTT